LNCLKEFAQVLARVIEGMPFRCWCFGSRLLGLACEGSEEKEVEKEEAIDGLHGVKIMK
jgi:hypothetical protein